MNDVGRNSLGVAGVILTLVAIGFGRTAASYLLKRNSSATDDARLRGAIFHTAAELEKKTPIRVNSQTTLVSVVSADKTILFTYKVAVTADKIDVASSRNAYWIDLVAMACNNPTTVKILWSGASYRFDFDDSSGEPIMGLTIDKSVLARCADH